ncbi:MAG TPA: glycosyltransferase [Candidatus Acidoferrales bacterium]|nr:glycosyltransferase [Candidatus Acidoferrales bacterium]
MISIVIPTFYEEKIIGSTLSSLASQLTLPHEIIVSDGGSRDSTVEIAAKYADRVVVHQGVERQTIAQGRNAGAKEARGEFLVFLDADCFVPDPDKFFQIAISNFAKFANLVALTSFLRVLPGNETAADKIVLGSVNLMVLLRNNFLKKGEVPGGEFQMIRREAFNQVGGYNEDLVTREDRDMFFRLSEIGRTLCDPRLVVFHTGRRAHRLGWLHMIGLFLVNTLYFHASGRIRSKEWTLVR